MILLPLGVLFFWCYVGWSRIHAPPAALAQWMFPSVGASSCPLTWWTNSEIDTLAWICWFFPAPLGFGGSLALDVHVSIPFVSPPLFFSLPFHSLFRSLIVRHQWLASRFWTLGLFRCNPSWLAFLSLGRLLFFWVAIFLSGPWIRMIKVVHTVVLSLIMSKD